MPDSWLDHIPSHEREKIRKRLRSPEEYERLREKVKGPEDLEREMERNAEFAETKLALESEPKAQEKAKAMVKEGIDAAFHAIPASAREQVAKGHFDVIITEQHHEPRLAVKIKNHAQQSKASSGNVAEVYPLRAALQQQILSTFTLK